MNETDFAIESMGEAAVAVSFGHVISPDIHQKVRLLGAYLDRHPFAGFTEVILSYTAVTVIYDPYAVHLACGQNVPPVQFVKDTLFQALAAAHTDVLPPPAVVTIPVCYGGEYGPDLALVAQQHDMAPEEVIEIHSSGEYLVYMIGFCPGFPYLGGLDERIATPRRRSPRLEIPARSVGIAGIQTGVYPLATPGGWQLIGRAAVDLFTPEHTEAPTLLHAGDIVRFTPISPEEYAAIRGIQP